MSAPSPLTFSQGTWLVAEREMGARVRSRAFVVSTLILLVLVLGGIIGYKVIPGLFDANSGPTTIAATSDTAAQLGDLTGVEVTVVASRDEAEALVKDETVDAAVIIDAASPAGVTVIGKTSAPESVTGMLTKSPTVVTLEEPDEPFMLRYFLGLGFGLLFMFAALNFGPPIASSVIEEKQNRIVEILLSAIPARTMLAGKVLGNSILAICQVILIAVTAIIGLIVIGETALLSSLGAPLLWFAVFFVFGFVLIAALFAALASLVSRVEDSGSVLTPVMIVVMLPMYLVMFLGDNPVAMAIMSYVPFTATVAMPVRLYFSDAQWWEPLISLVILAVACLAIVAIGAKIYQNSLLKMGSRIKLMDALRGAN